MTSEVPGLAARCGITAERWEKLKDDHISLDQIYEDFKGHSDELTNVAVTLSSFLQRMPGVHSVRWRIKSPEHLISKICRKKEAGIPKYAEISAENYREIVTDLIGVRVLHLVKESFASIHNGIISTWDVSEEPIAYLRAGDQQELRDLYSALGLNVENHDDGYRSIHYIITTRFTKAAIKCELQVRTIFEEGWSEIDHMIRYPDFSKEPLVLEFVNIFNRLSGAADEMGTFALKLAKDIEQIRDFSAKKELDAEKSYQELTSKIKELEVAHSRNDSLKKELSVLRKMAERSRKIESIESDALRLFRRRLTTPATLLMEGSESRASDKHPTGDNVKIETIRSFGFTPESYSREASASKTSIAESVARSNERDLRRLSSTIAFKPPTKK